jgi:hypothetical protein
VDNLIQWHIISKELIQELQLYKDRLKVDSMVGFYSKNNARLSKPSLYPLELAPQPEIGPTLNPAKTISGVVQLSNSFSDSSWPKAIAPHILLRAQPFLSTANAGAPRS